MRRYNYAGSGYNGSNNKNKKYIDYTKTPIITPEIEERLNDYNIWFSDNYNNIVKNLINKNNYNEEVLSDTYFKLHRLLSHGGLIKNYQYYFNTSYFTNQFNYTVTSTRYNNKIEYISTTTYDIDIIDDDNTEFQYEKKDALINEISEYLELNVPDIIERDLFIIYINTRFDNKIKMTYEKLANITNIPIERIKEIIPRIKKALNNKFKNKRLNTL